MSIKIILADDHVVVRQGLRSLLKEDKEIEIVGEADDGHQVIDMVEKLSPDMVVMDVTMPGLNGIEATRKIVAGPGSVKVLALSIHSDKRFILNMFGAGAYGYMLKECAFEELKNAIHTVSRGEFYLSPRIAGIVIKDFFKKSFPDKSSAFSVLTPREREVLQLLAEGKTTKEVARVLSVSVKTAETHRQQIMSKLEIHSIAELTKYALREGLTSL